MVISLDAEILPSYECSCNGHYSGNGKVGVDATECNSDKVTVNE